MADIIDEANEAAEIFLKSALYQHQRKDKPISSKGVGFCIYCGEDIIDDRRWCDARCRDEWEKEHDKT